MAPVRVDISSFRGKLSHLNARHRPQITLGDIVWGAVTVGIPSAFLVFRSPAFAWAFTGHKTLSIHSIIEDTPSGLAHPFDFRGLDPSEKVALSFWLGMAMSKVIAADFFQVPWLIHARAFAQANLLAASNPTSRVLPDLVGFDLNLDWHVVEAKSRQNNPGATDKAKWKAQASAISSIAGVKPLSGFYCFTQQVPQVRVEVVDPPPSEHAYEVKVSSEVIRERYYAPYKELFSRPQDLVGLSEAEGYVFSRIVEDRVSRRALDIGVPERFLKSRFRELPIEPRVPINISKNFHIGADHIAVRVAPENGEEPR